MNKADIFSGEWIGYYEYSASYGEAYEGKRMTFSVVLQYNNGDISGVCKELEGFGINPNSASINGFIEGKTISFIKKYPFYYEVDGEGNVNFDTEREHPDINYFGEYYEQEQLFKGEWEIELDLYMEGKTFIAPVISGTWELRKK